MAVGIAVATLNAWLNALCRNVSYTQPTQFWVKLHTGDPGSAGANNAFGDATRKQATFSAASGASITVSGALAWTNLSAGGTISHASFWDASTAGTFLGSGALTASKTVNSGDNFTIPASSLTLNVTPVAA